MSNCFADNRGTISQNGNVMRVDNALVEEVTDSGRGSGSILISYAIRGARCLTSIEVLQLNVSGNTLITNPSGRPMRLRDIRKGMWIDALFSPVMTRSLPPQSKAFFIMVRRQVHERVDVTTDRIASVDFRNGFLYTGTPGNLNRQMRFVITDHTVILDRNGSHISLRSLRPGQKVRITHANFQTASIPPQTTAFLVQLL